MTHFGYDDLELMVAATPGAIMPNGAITDNDMRALAEYSGCSVAELSIFTEDELAQMLGEMHEADEVADSYDSKFQL